jgi:hypothetical protein
VTPGIKWLSADACAGPRETLKLSSLPERSPILPVPLLVKRNRIVGDGEMAELTRAS